MSDFAPSWMEQKAVPSTRSIVVRMVLGTIIGLGVLVYGILRALDTGTFTWVHVVTTLVGLLVLVLAVLSVRKLPLARELDSSGITTQGRIVTKRSTTDEEGDRSCYVAYTFGEGYGAQQQVSSAVYRRLQSGDTVEIRYLARDPNLSRMEI